MSTRKPAKVFVSHASEDKERFVNRFAMQLRQNGVDAWIDKWEMLPGDSLVGKIFGEGLKEAQAVIIVLSRVSVLKSWVREEIDAAFVKRVTGATKIIPVIIDDCAVPECLKSTLWQKIANLDSFDEELKRIVLSIYGGSEKPEVGELPTYARHSRAPIGGLTKLDSIVLCELCEAAITENSEFLPSQTVDQVFRNLEVSDSDFRDSLTVLVNDGYFMMDFHPPPGFPRIQVTTSGLEVFLRETGADYEALKRRIGFLIVNEGLESSQKLRERITEPTLISDHLITTWENNALLKVSWFLGGSYRVNEVSPKLKRWLQDS